MRNSVFSAKIIIFISIIYFITSAAATSPSLFSANQLTITNTVIDVGQISVANIVVSGGSGGPYSGQWSWINSNETTFQLVNTIAVGSTIDAFAINPQGTIAYAANGTYSGSQMYGNTIFVIDLSSNTVVNTIKVGATPLPVFSPSGSIAYISVGACDHIISPNCQGDTINVTDVATNTVINSIVSGTTPLFLSFNPSGTLVYVPNLNSGTVNVIDVATNVVVNTIIVGSSPSAAVFNPSGTLAYVTNLGSKSISVIDVSTNTVVKTIPVGNGFSGPWQIAFNPSGTLAYVANGNCVFACEGNTISVINVATNTVVNTISTSLSSGAAPSFVQFNPSGTIALAANQGGNFISVIDVATNTVIKNIPLLTSTTNSNFNPLGTMVYVVNYDPITNTIRVYGSLPETSLQEIPSSGTMQLEISPTNQNTMTFTFNGVSYIQSTDSNTVYGTWPLYGFAQDNGTNIYYYGSNTVLLSNTLTIDPAPSVSLTVQTGSGIPTNAIMYGNSIITTAAVTGGTGNFIYAFTLDNAEAQNTVSSSTLSSTNTLDALTVPGNYVFNVIVTDTGTTTHYSVPQVTNTVVIESNDLLSATSSGNPGFAGFYSAVNITFTGTPTIDNQSAWSLYVNGALFGKTDSVMHWAEQGSPGTYSFTFTNPGNSNYTSASLASTLKVGSLGTGGSGVSSSSPPPSTTTPSTAVTTAPPSTSLNDTVNLMHGASQQISFNNTRVTIQLVSNSSSNSTVKLLVVNVTALSPNAPSGFIKLSATNITSNTTKANHINVKYSYPCSIFAAYIKPFILENGMWDAISPFTVNATSCTVSFSIPADPVVAIMEQNHTAPKAPSNASAVSTLLPTTAIAAPHQVPSSTSGMLIIAAVIIAIIIIAAILYMLKNRRPRLGS